MIGWRAQGIHKCGGTVVTISTAGHLVNYLATHPFACPEAMTPPGGLQSISIPPTTGGIKKYFPT